MNIIYIYIHIHTHVRIRILSRDPAVVEAQVALREPWRYIYIYICMYIYTRKI